MIKAIDTSNHRKRKTRLSKLCSVSKCLQKQFSFSNGVAYSIDSSVHGRHYVSDLGLVLEPTLMIA
ncbi:MAG: hypothetical protein CM1200mP18_14290 [Gammaproteobacteria bacterium]|nr:MAG: hypothetical protein CM1200mP18_14290 [Gammaproteobacteria bacterium]